MHHSLSKSSVWQLLVLVILFDIFFLLNHLASGQRSASQARRDGGASRTRGYKVKQVERSESGARLQCLTCSADFSSRLLDITDICYNPASSTVERVKSSLLTVCPPDALFCQAQVHRIGGVFAGISRQCGGAVCIESCTQSGYGAEREVCTFCCGGIHTNETTTLDVMTVENGENTITMEMPSKSVLDKFNCP